MDGLKRDFLAFQLTPARYLRTLYIFLVLKPPCGGEI